VQAFTNLGTNIQESFIGWNSLYHITGAASTYLLVNNGVDYRVKTYFEKNRSLGNLFYPVAITGSEFQVLLLRFIQPLGFRP